jgi:hypothetical protein
MKIKLQFLLRVRLLILKRILLLLSMPAIVYSCKTTHNKQDAVYSPRTDVVQKDTIQTDTVPPIFYNPVPVCDYGVLPVTPVYYEPYPVCEYGVVPPDLEREE